MKLRVGIIIGVLFVASSLLLLIIGFWWLLFPVFYVWVVFFVKIKQKWVNNVIKLLGTILLAIFIKLFLVEVYQIPSGSMEGTLTPGDRIVVNKLVYGPTIPRSPFDIPWVNILFLLNNKAKERINEDWWDCRRLKGMSEISRGEVIVFNFSKNSRECFIKRCVSLPRDTFQIIDSKVFNNGELFNEPLVVKHNFNLINKKTRFARAMTMNLSLSEAQRMVKEGEVDSIALSIVEKDTMMQLLPWDKNYQWSIDNFGPLVIPGKGMAIELTKENYTLYKSILNSYENFNPELRDNSFFIDGKEVNEFSFTKDYYFMMGDNRSNSVDSRFQGFVPEEQIIGKATKVLYSKYWGEFNWYRLYDDIE